MQSAIPGSGGGAPGAPATNPGENDALIICIAICLDRIHQDEERQR
jgi:hypothetical protein